MTFRQELNRDDVITICVALTTCAEQSSGRRAQEYLNEYDKIMTAWNAYATATKLVQPRCPHCGGPQGLHQCTPDRRTA